MDENLKKLAEALFVDSKALSSDDLVQKLRSDDAIRLGLNSFYSILKRGVEVLGDGRLGLQLWNDSQIQAISSFTYAIASASRSLSVEQAEAILVAIVQKSIEFAVCYMETFGCNDDDLGIQNNLIHLLEIALVDEMDKTGDILLPRSVTAFVDILPVVDASCDFVDDHIKCHLEGLRFSKEGKTLDLLLKTLASERVLPDRKGSGFSGSTYCQDCSKLVFISQQWAVSHGKYIPRLILLCNKLIKVKDVFDERVVGVIFPKRLSFTLRIFKILGSLNKDAPCVEYDASLVKAVASFADALSSLFRVEFEFVCTYAITEGSFESIILMVVEEFLHIVQVIFSNSNVPQNVQACIVASIMESLDSSVWRYDKSASNLKIPLAYFPRCVIYTLKLIDDLKRQRHQVFLEWIDFDAELAGSSNAVQNDLPSCIVHNETVSLLKKYTNEELLRLVFPASSQWVDNLMQLVLFLHSEGVKLWSKMERSSSNSAKFSCSSDVENALCHEDEAIFGDLFCETGRSVGSADGCEPLPAAAVSSSSHHNMPIQAATELLYFLKTSVFSPEWHHSLYEDGCSKISTRHVDILLSLLNCYDSSEDNMSHSFTSLHGDKKIGQIHELCFDLLHSLLTHCALAGSLEVYLVEKILTVENGAFSYNNRTLTLLAHTLFSRAGSVDSLLRTKIYQAYVSFIVDKAKSICVKCPSVKDLIGTLPSLFHNEIVLMAFHLSAGEEKAVLANLIFSNLKEASKAAMDLNSTQLTCWALVVSRLILMLHHMIIHQHTCPTPLLLDVRSKLREAPLSGSSMPYNVNDHLSSWSSNALKNIMGRCHGEEALLSSLTDQMIDASGSSSLARDDLEIDSLNLNWNDIYMVFSQVLGFWRGKKASALEDLVVERYLFSLCGDIPFIGSEEHQTMIPRSGNFSLDLSDMLHFFHFSHSLLGHHEVIEKCTTSPDVILSLLQHLDALSIPDDIDELGWDFLRNGMWLSLVLSFINIGIWRYCTDNGLSKEGLIWTESPFGDQNNVKLAGSMISSMIEAGQFASLVGLFSSLLNKYVQIHQKAFLATLSYKQKLAPGFSPILLLKHTRIDKCLQDELLQRSGSNLSELEFVLGVLSRLDATVQRKASGMLSRASPECLLHGFPFHLSTYSATMLSSILSIRGIIFILDGLLRIQDVGGNLNLEIEVLQQILDVVMDIKFDRMFVSIHEKCDSIHHHLSAEMESSTHANLILMKQMEGFLRDMNAGGVGDGIVDEWMISNIIDILSSLRKDPSKLAIFQFYLGVENVSGQINRLLRLHPGGCLVLIDSLDSCYSESVNVKVLGFFVDLLSSELFPDLRMRMQRKFLDKDTHNLAKWLETRLLGSLMDSGGGPSSAKGCSTSLRESTMNFILCLVSSSSEQSKELLHHIFDSALLSLDTAFLQFDIHAAKSYFNFIVQISKGEYLIKLLLTKTVMLMQKLVGNDHLLPGLKFLFGFIENVLSDCDSGKISPQRTTSKCSSGTSLGVGHVAGPVGSRKNSETFVLSANQEGRSASLECDATSVDDDEDDASSDGEVVSIDKDEDEDANSERVLASKVCTFTSSGSNFMEQHWYFCYTCDLTVSKGCCSVCAKVCHRGHRVVYSRSSRFFCDCGAGGVRGSNCQCLKPRKFTGSSSAPDRSTNTFQSFLPFSEDGDQLPDSDSDFEEDICSNVDNSLKLSIPKELQDGIPLLLEELDMESQVLNLCTSLMPSIINRRDSDHLKDKKIMLGEDKVLSYGVDLLQLKKAYKSGSLDLKIKVDYSNAKELKSHLASGSLVKSLLSVSQRGRLAVGEGDKVAIFDVEQLIGQATIAPVTAEKTNVKPLSKNVVRFEIVQLAFNPVVDNYLVVAGYEDCQVLTLNPRGEVIDRLAVELALQGAYIRRVDWVPGSQVQLMVVTNRFVKIYDLSLDNISPMHYFTLPDDMIVDATLYLASQGRMFLIVLSENGSIFRLELSVKGNVGAMPLNEIVQLQGKEIHAKCSSLYFFSTYKLLFISFQDGTTVIGRLSSDAASLVDMSSVYEEQDGSLRPAAVHHWKELVAGSGLFVCISSGKSNSALAVSMGEREILAQSMRHPVGSTSPIVGATAYKPLSKDKIHCLVLHDDGSLQIYSHVPLGIDAGMSAASEKVKKLGSNILSKSYAGTNPEFPLDFFEKTVCITSDAKLGGEAIRNGDSEGAKQNLVNEDGFLESPSPAGFKISVFNSNADIVMVGFRVHVGNTSASHIPSSISIFQRVIKLDEGMRSWYDIPFTVAESLLADEEFTISAGPTFNGSTLPRIDSLEVYGRAKDEFGWKEKMDSVLDMEARALSLNSSVAASGKKCQSMQSAPIQEQVIADGLKLITKFYSLCRQQGCSRLEEARAELSKLKCKHLLEIIFERDREPVLQASACHVLQAVFPKKEIYHQVKDNMRLLGVVKSTSILSSRLGTGGSTGSWIIEEFTAQMRAVCKIALQRRSNLATFLETNGSEVVDALMQILWEILDFEQPDTQTMNNLVMSAVELIYCYAECLALHGKDVPLRSVAPAVALLKKLLFSSNEAVQTSSSLAISSRLLQVPFPKQNMLATDDAVESVVSVHGATDASDGNNQVMIEEDSITSSVQYCCDGCSTVPILRRRWHCTVCPDFDLCEACYEVLDTDRLPPPHSRDHPMTAIPIEVDSVGDGNEFHFTPDDVSDPNLLPIPADGSMQNSSPSIHVLEPHDSGEFGASLTDPVSISASKRAVNSLLLSEVLEQLKGWMDTTSGVRAIPVLQLFYRLSSAVGGPFIDSSKPDSLDLEKLIKWFLDEINLNKPFVAKTRSLFGEVAILVFMFFTLMLRNWHNPGSDNSMPRQSGTVDTHDKNVIQLPLPTTGSAKPSADDHDKSDFSLQLQRACDSLRQQSFVDYLMDILQQLVNVFKSPVNSESALNFNAGPGCGALLTVRRDLPAGNFLPFFSDSYAKAHRTDIFMDYHRLLLENTFRLVYTLVRPEKHDKIGEKEKVYKVSSGKDLKLDGYQDVLCSYINNPHTNFVRRYARRLFLHLCGSKSHYYSVRDSWQFSSEVKRLYKHVNKSGGFQNSIPYGRSVKIVKCLSTMAEVASARPRNWQKYCLRHGDILPFLVDGVFYLGEESVIQTLKLLNLAFYTGKDISLASQKTESGDTSSNKSGSLSQEVKKKKKGEDGAESGLEKSYLDMEAEVDVFTDKGGDISKQFIDCFLLEWNSSTVRAEAKLVLYGVWHHAKQSFKEILLMALLQKVKFLPMYGQNIVEYAELVTWLLGKSPDMGSKHQISEFVDRCLTPDVIRCIFETLHSQNELLANHPNSRIYNTLSGLVEFDGYYLESEPCVACSSPEVPYSRMKLESLKSETKFTDNLIIVKCTGSYTIQTVTMNVHDARKSKSVKVLNLYYNNRPVSDLSELKNNWSLWKRAKSCHLAFNQTELKVEFPIPITACNFMIELDSFYENLQALSLEPLQCPRCSRPVTEKHGICSNCHEIAHQCRQCRNINYENLDSFLCNECGYSKYGRFEFNFMAKPSFTFDNMENHEDMKRGLAAIESESENAHRRYQQLLGFKKPLLKIVSSVGENDMDSQQKDSVQQMMVSIPGPSCKINRKIALLGVLYGEKCKAAFDSVSKSVQTLQGLRKVLMNYLHQKHSDNGVASRFVVSRSPNNCYGCATTFVTQCLEILQVLARHPNSKKLLVSAGILSELFENNIHQGPKAARGQARAVLCSLSEGDVNAITELNSLIHKKVMYCLEHHRSMDIAVTTREEMLLLSEVCSLADEFWESRLRIVFQLLFSSIKLGAKHPAVSEHVILPCLRIISQACIPPKPDTPEKEQSLGKSQVQTKDEGNTNASGILSNVSGTKSFSDSSERNWDATPKTQDIQLLSYSEWERGASYIDFVRRQYKVSQAVKAAGPRSRPQRHDYLALKYALRWKRRVCTTAKSNLSAFELGSWVKELVLSACSQSIRSEMCMVINLLCAQSSSRRFRLLNLLVSLLPATLPAGESAAEYFELLFKIIDSEDAHLFLTVRGCLQTICTLITQEVNNVESLERSLHINISQGFILHKLIELLGKFLKVPNVRSRFMRDNLLSEILEALIVIRGLIVQKTKLISDCNRLLKDLIDSLLLESSENKRKFIRACINGLQIHGEERKGRTCLFILEQLCNLICPSKPEPVYLLVLNKAHTQEEFIRGSMTKNPYSSAEIGPLMRDVKNKICHQLDLLSLLEDDYGMELLVAGNIISLDLSVAQVYEQVWKKSNQSSNSVANSTLLSTNAVTTSRDCPPMNVTYRLQGLDGEATEPMIKELEEDREETQDPEVEFAIAGAVCECGGLEILLRMIQRLRDDFKSNKEQLVAVLNLLMYCCKIREKRRALMKLGALGLLLETARRAFSVDAMEPAEGILLIVESLTLEANESDNISITHSSLTVTSEEAGIGEEAKKIVLMFLERLSHPLGLKKSNKQQRNTEMVARILPYLTYGEPAAMEALIQHFSPYLQDWGAFDHLQKQSDDVKDESIAQQALKQRFTLENFVRVSESLKTSSCGERLKDIILEKGITGTAIRHLKNSFGNAGQAGVDKTNVEWASGLELPSVPLILSMLTGLSMGHLPTQRCIDEEGVLPLLHALEGVSGKNEIGARAENLLDTLSNKEGEGDGFLGEKVIKLRHATKYERKRRALLTRKKVLQGLGMHEELSLDGGERIVVSRPVLVGLEDVQEEEDGLACRVCREGYSLRPTDLLGAYSYSKRVNLGVGASGNPRGECVYTTVSYFNIIHFQCHQEARRANAALSNPKKEWEGATLRNNESLCNSLFPVRGPSVPQAQYICYVDQYWDNLNALGRADGSRLRLLTYDIVLMLARFATGASFSADCRGGGRESNSKFLPFMIQMAHHLLDQGSSSQRRTMARAVSAYITSSTSDPRSPTPSGPQPTIGTEETVQFMMVNSLLSESYESWLHHRHAFLQRGIYHAYMQHIHSRSPARSSSGSATPERVESSETGQNEELLSIIRPMLVYTGLIEQLQQFFKMKKPAGSMTVRTEGRASTAEPTTTEGEEEGGNLEGWEVVMKDRLLNVKELLGFSKEMLSWLDEMNSASDLQESFDIVGVLADVMSGGFTRCDDFVQAAINASKS